MKGIIYFTNNKPIKSIFEGVQKQILKSGLPIASASVKPIDFGNNIVVSDESIMGYFKRIVAALEGSSEKYVFFCESDVLYHISHFDFTPARDDTFYYNTNIWKWDYDSKRVVAYDHQASLSGLCCNRELALKFFKRRLEIIYANGWDKLPTGGNPSWARNLGYEPGRHKGNTLEPALSEEWSSQFPIIDIRANHNMTPKKMDKDGFRKKPTGWREDLITNIPGWENYDFFLL